MSKFIQMAEVIGNSSEISSKLMDAVYQTGVCFRG